MSRLTIAMVVLALAFASHATLIRVPADQPTMQDGISVASEGDTVQVAPGTYTGEGNRALAFGGTNLVLVSEAGPGVTVIDCEGVSQAFIFNGAGEDTTAVVSGFTIINGVGTYGGAVVIVDPSEPKIRDCIFEYNDGGWGGAIALRWGGRAVIEQCIFRFNTGSEGGAVHTDSASPIIRDCEFLENSGLAGGAMAWHTIGWGDSPCVVNCTFERNVSQTDGGAVWVQAFITGSPQRDEWWDCTWVSEYRASLFLNCVFEGNVASSRGGAIWASDDHGFGLNAVNCIFRDNEADRGGAVYHVWGDGSLYCGCTFYDNRASVGGAGYFRHDCNIYYSTFCFNNATSGAALAVSASYGMGGGVSRSVFAFNDGGPVVDCGIEEVSFHKCVAYSNPGGNYLCPDGTDNTIADPLFCDVPARDFTVCANSPCLPENNSLGEQIGAHGVGCEACISPVEQQTWGGLKALFR